MLKNKNKQGKKQQPNNWQMKKKNLERARTGRKERKPRKNVGREESIGRQIEFGEEGCTRKVKS